MKLDDRFLQKVNITKSCWLWTAALYKNGYGAFYYNKKSIKAHRFSYELYHGSIPKDLYVLHKCDVKACVNPHHLFLGTSKDNTEDCIKKGRNSKGEVNGQHKLTQTEVLTIRNLYATGEVTQKALSKTFDVSPSSINNIVHNKRWKHI
jgi:hypothetical protein